MVVDKIFKIRDVVVRVNRNKRTLIRWEQSGKIPTATRNKINERIYSEKDIQIILDCMKENSFYRRRPKR